MPEFEEQPIRYVNTEKKIDYGRTPVKKIEGGKTPANTDVGTVAQLPTPPKDGSGTKPIPKTNQEK